jgi:hypothetical protein
MAIQTYRINRVYPVIKGIVSILAIAMSTSIDMPLAQALPGQSSDDVLQWMKANEGLTPDPGERLTVRRSNGPAQRLTFEASPLAPGRIGPNQSNGKIRTETLTVFDILYGVTDARLEESLRSIYGSTVYREFKTAKIVYAYPTEDAVQKALKAKQPIAAALKGELRQGQNFAYWVEIARNPEGLNYSGKVMVFLPEDLPKLEGELKGR